VVLIHSPVIPATGTGISDRGRSCGWHLAHSASVLKPDGALERPDYESDQIPPSGFNLQAADFRLS